MSSLFQTIRREWWGMVPPVPGPWPREDVALVEQMQAVRPGLTTEQAHTALQALRTLGAVVHRGGHTCPIPGHAADGDEVCTAQTVGVCTAQTVGVWDIPLRCAIGPLSAHTGDWHQDARGSRWRDSLAGSTRIHAADSPPPQASPEWTAHLHRDLTAALISPFRSRAFAASDSFLFSNTATATQPDLAAASVFFVSNAFMLKSI